MRSVMGRDQSPWEEGGIGGAAAASGAAGTPTLQSQSAPAAQLHHRHAGAV